MLSEERKAAERLTFKFLAAVALFFLASWLIPEMWDKLSPFLIAIPIAAMLQPVIRFFDSKLKIKRGATSLVMVILILVLTYLALRWFTGLVIETATQILGEDENILTTTVKSINDAIENLKKNISWDQLGPNVQFAIESSVMDLTGTIMEKGTDIAKKAFSLITSFPYLLIYTSFLAMALFFISRDYENIRSYLPGGTRRRQDSNTTRLTNSAIRSLIGYLRVQGTFSVMVLIVSLIFLHVFHFDYAGAVAVLAAFMELIPMIGSGLLYILMGVIFLLTGNTPAGIQVLLLTGFLQLVRRLLEPKLMSNSIGITPLESLIGMFAGMRFGGIPGLIGGPVLMSVLVGAMHGPSYEMVKKDIRCLRLYFHQRWLPSPPANPPEGESPPDEESPTSEETPVSE